MRIVLMGKETITMNKIDNSFNESVSTFVTESGLYTYIIHHPGFKRSAAVYGTPFGALNIQQRKDGEIIEHKKGVQHFLEHKLFEDEAGDILSQFAAMGASGNAFTSYEQTFYYFGHNGAIEAPLSLLLDFVSSFTVTADSVEKEKGIIVEEMKMYEQRPITRLINETYRNALHQFPFIYDIVGTEESINATTLEDLRKAYDLNYNDSRMVLAIVTPEDPEVVKEIVERKTKNHIKVESQVEDVYPDEPLEVKHTRREIFENVETPKMSLSFKLPYTGTSLQKEEFLFDMLLEMNFSELNPHYQTWLDEGAISHSFAYGTEVQNTFVLITFFNEGTEYARFEEIIIDQMVHLIADQEQFDQLKKRYYGEMVMSLSNADDLAVNVAREHFQEMHYFGFLSMVQALTFEDILEIKAKVKTDNSSFLLMSQNQ